MTEEHFPYRIIEEYIRGGCSVIYRIEPIHQPPPEKNKDKPLVLKTMLPDDTDPAAEKRFYMEYEFLRAYPHKNLIEVMDYFPKWRGNPAYIMEWVEGNTWQSFWQDRNPMDHLETFFLIMNQLCNVLDFIHKHQIIHRDLKPQNILITQFDQLKLIDFGIMKVQDLTLFTNRNSFMGSAYYVAPECLSGDDVTNAADIFSLGVMIYDLLTGVKPFRGHTLAETVYQRLVSVPKPPSTFMDLPKELDSFFERILHLEPHNRQNSCQEVYNDLFAILAKDMQSPVKVPSETELDVCTQSQFMHTHFLEECIPELEKQKVLYITGPSGSGKDTIVENLPEFIPFESILKTDIHESLTQNDLIEIILTQTGPPAINDPKMEHWLSILATALPQLGWKVPIISYQIHTSSILTAFLNILQHFKKRTLILLTCVEPPSKSLLQFLNHFFFFLKRECAAPFFTVFTSEKKFERLANLIPPLKVPFPDVVTLSDFISSQFNQARVPLDVTTRIGNESQNHLGTFLKRVDQYRKGGLLFLKDGVVCLEQDPLLKTTQIVAQNTIPGELRSFSKEQLKHLEWLALNPEGVDIGVLKQLTQVDFETLGKTLTIAKDNDLLDFKTGSTQGLIWKKKRIRDFLLKSMEKDEKSSRSLILAKTIEEVSQPYINFSPPLWRIMAVVFREGDDTTTASEYALRYARYCFQSAQYESIRLTLSPFQDLPSVQNNHDFWFLLAMAFRSEDPKKSLVFGKKAFEILPDPKTKALLAILEFDMGHYKESFHFVDLIFSNQEYESLDINISTQLISLLIAANQFSRARGLIKILGLRTRQDDNPYAQNLYVLAKMQVLEQNARRALEFSSTLPTDLLQSTQMKIKHLSSLCHISLFQLQEGENNLETMLSENNGHADRDRFLFREELFFYLAFHNFKRVRKILASEQAKDPAQHALVQLTSQLLTGDPQIYAGSHIQDSLKANKQSLGIWLPLFCSLLDPRKMPVSLVNQVVLYTKNNVPFWTRHQTPRFSLIQKFVQEEYSDIPTYLLMVIKYAQKYELIMETLRIESLQDMLISEGILADRIMNPLLDSLKNSPMSLQYLASKPF